MSVNNLNTFAKLVDKIYVLHKGDILCRYSFSKEELNFILTRIFDGWLIYKVKYNCSFDNYWVFLGYLFPTMISYNSRPVMKKSVLASMCESKQIMLLEEPYYHYRRFLCLLRYISVAMEDLDTNKLSDYWQGPLGLKRHFELCSLITDDHNPILMEDVGLNYLLNSRDYPEVEWNLDIQFDNQMYNYPTFPDSLQEFYDNRVSASRQAYFQELAQLEPEIFLSLDIVYLCFIDDMSRIFSSYFIDYGN
jgi:hypothetical protein